MRDKLTDRQTIAVQAKVIKNLAETLREIWDTAKSSLEYAEKQGWKQSKSMLKIFDLSNRKLTYLDCRASDIEELKREIPKAQSRLPGVK